MGKVEIKLNQEGVRELMQSREMMAACEGYARKAAGMLGDGYEVTTHVGKTRVNAEVAAVSFKAKRENMKDNTILKAIGSVGE